MYTGNTYIIKCQSGNPNNHLIPISELNIKSTIIKYSYK